MLDDPERFFRQVAAVIRLPCPGLLNKVPALIGKGMERLCILPIRQIIQKLLRQVFQTGIGKSGNSITGGGNPPVPVFHADKEQNSVLSIAAIIIEIIRKGHGRQPFGAVHSYNHCIHSICSFDLIQFFQNICFFRG